MLNNYWQKQGLQQQPCLPWCVGSIQTLHYVVNKQRSCDCSGFKCPHKQEKMVLFCGCILRMTEYIGSCPSCMLNVTYAQCAQHSGELKTPATSPELQAKYTNKSIGVRVCYCQWLKVTVNNIKCPNDTAGPASLKTDSLKPSYPACYDTLLSIP